MIWSKYRSWVLRLNEHVYQFLECWFRSQNNEFHKKNENLTKNFQLRKMSVKVELNVWITKKRDLIQSQEKILIFDRFGWNASESEVGQSYEGHEENKFKMKRDVLWSEVKKSLSAKKWISFWMRFFITKHLGFGEKFSLWSC